ncbi:MAG: hypothetical protein LUE23_01275 [Lachnospiraceae bacterium]|nr:hypothetical protein [Lachnospiraceae bacterium]
MSVFQDDFTVTIQKKMAAGDKDFVAQFIFQAQKVISNSAGRYLQLFRCTLDAAVFSNMLQNFKLYELHNTAS